MKFLDREALAAALLSLVLGVCVLIALAGCGVAPSLTDEVRDAQDAWGVLEMCDVQVVDVSQDVLDRVCEKHLVDVPPGGAIQGCAKIPRCEIFVVKGLDWQRRSRVLQHELGHLIKGSPGHLKCLDVPGDDVMCPDGGGPWVDGPTDRDHSFVEAR